MTGYAIVLTHNRPDHVRRCVEAVSPQVDEVIVVDNASDQPTSSAGWDVDQAHVSIVHDSTQPAQLGVLWNRYLDVIQLTYERSGHEPYEVALLCDDAIVPPGWFNQVVFGLRQFQASAASTHSYAPVSMPYLLTELTNDRDRLCPWAFVLAGEQQLRADESMRWFYVDTDLDWQARLRNGSVIVPGPVVPNELTGDWTQRKPELYQQALLDERTFRTKWNRS